MGFKCGIVGLPNVGKSTLFNALTESNKAEAANYPFATIQPNIGRIPVPDERLNKLSIINSSIKTIPTFIDFVDIAGLVKGASKGEGLGNKFLSHIREMDAIAHVVRCFDNTNITHVSSSINPIHDIEIIETELILSDIETLENKIKIFKNAIKGGDKKIENKINFFNLLLEHLNNYKLLNSYEWSNEQQIMINELNLITNKPFFYICNIDEESINKGNSFSDLVKKKSNKEGSLSVLVSAAIESQISQINNKEERHQFIKELDINETSIKKIINLGYDLLNLITFFTSGPKETRAWTVKKNTKISIAAGKIHTDFEKGFIRSETISYNDFIKFKGEINCREAGKLRQEGKNYLVQDGDIINILFNI